MNHQEYKAKKKEIKEKLASLNELARLERMGIGKEAARILEKERRAAKKELRKKVTDES